LRVGRHFISTPITGKNLNKKFFAILHGFCYGLQLSTHIYINCLSALHTTLNGIALIESANFVLLAKKSGISETDINNIKMINCHGQYSKTIQLSIF
jgi:hypothetical protein